MTQFPAPPEGYEVIEAEEDSGVMTAEKLRFQAPDGEILTFAEMVDAGLMEGE